MLQRCYALSPRSRLEARDGAWWLLCDHPLQAIRVNESAARLVAALRPGVPLDALAGGVTRDTLALLDALAQRGVLRAEYCLQPATSLPPVEVVVPAYGDAAGLARCLAALAAQDIPADRMRVTVVDDASPEPLEAALAGAPPLPPRLRWVRLPANAGPASARNAGARTLWPEDEPPAPLLAFVDADCVPAPGWLAALAALLETPDVAAAGGAVRGLSREGLLARYEDACSSLYLGPRPGPVGLPEAGPAYLPSCNLAVRRTAFEAVEGFRAGWRFAEDVDLCWRLHDAGHALLYHPAAEVAHAHRTRWGPFLQRRRAYARSEARLRRAYPARFPHRGRRAPLLVLAGIALGLLGWPAGGGLLAAGALATLLAAPLWRARHAPPRAWGARVLLWAGLRGTAARLLAQCRALNRHTLVFWLPALGLWPAGLPLAGAVLAAGALGEWLARRPGLGQGTFLAGYTAECLAYSLGRAEGALREAWRARWTRSTPAAGDATMPTAPPAAMAGSRPGDASDQAPRGNPR